MGGALAPVSECPQLARALGLRDAVLLNVVAIVGLRWLATAAQTGPQSLALWALARGRLYGPGRERHPAGAVRAGGVREDSRGLGTR